MMFSSKILV